MSASAGILRTELHFESRWRIDCCAPFQNDVSPTSFFEDRVAAGLRPAWTGQKPRPHTNKLKTIETRPGQPVTSLSKLDHSANRLDWRIISKGRCHNPATSG